MREEAFLPRVSNQTGCWNLKFFMLFRENTQKCAESLHSCSRGTGRGASTECLHFLLGTLDASILSHENRRQLYRVEKEIIGHISKD